MKEFDIIKQYFTEPYQSSELILGIGDDAAVIDIPTGMRLVTCVDTLVAGKHFFHDQDANSIGHKSLAVNLSDIAAMGAIPKYYLLSLTLPEVDNQWLTDFSVGIKSLAKVHNVELIGGDLSKGPLSISVTAYGFVEIDRHVCRSGAQPEDSIFVTGYLGDAGLALELSSLNQSGKQFDQIKKRLLKPMPRISVGRKLSGIAHSMIDVSDGLLLDLGRLVDASHVGAQIELDNIPVSMEAKQLTTNENAINKALTAGDDYELCFTVAENQLSDIQRIQSEENVLITKIGKITGGNTVQCLDKNGNEQIITNPGFEHFD